MLSNNFILKLLGIINVKIKMRKIKKTCHLTNNLLYFKFKRKKVPFGTFFLYATEAFFLFPIN